MHATMNNVDNYSGYNKICMSNPPTPEITTTSEDIPKQPEEPITAEDKTAIAKPSTEEHETTTTKH